MDSRLLRLKQKDVAVNYKVNLSFQSNGDLYRQTNILKISLNLPAVCITHCPSVSSPLLLDSPAVAGYSVGAPGCSRKL